MSSIIPTVSPNLTCNTYLFTSPKLLGRSHVFAAVKSLGDSDSRSGSFVFVTEILRKIGYTRRPLSVKRFMDFVMRSKEGGESSEEALVERLRQFVEKSDLSFYEIASRIGTSGGILSMWLARKAKPHAEELAAIERFLKG